MAESMLGQLPHPRFWLVATLLHHDGVSKVANEPRFAPIRRHVFWWSLPPLIKGGL